MLKCHKKHGKHRVNFPVISVVSVRFIVHIVYCFMLFKENVFAPILLIFLLICVDNDCVWKEHNYHLLHFFDVTADEK